MITIEGLTKKYGTTLAVDDVSFTAEAGRVTGFLGPNGAGKSTALRIMVGLTRPDAGTATISGRHLPLRAGAATCQRHLRRQLGPRRHHLRLPRHGLLERLHDADRRHRQHHVPRTRRSGTASRHSDRPRPVRQHHHADGREVGRVPFR